MTAHTTHTLWSDPDRTQYYLVPDDADLPAGDVVLRTPAGREMNADAAALAPYAVTREEAKAHLDAQLEDVLAEMRTRVEGFVERLRSRTAEMRAEREAAAAEFRAQMRAGPGSAPSDQGEHPVVDDDRPAPHE